MKHDLHETQRRRMIDVLSIVDRFQAPTLERSFHVGLLRRTLRQTAGSSFSTLGILEHYCTSKLVHAYYRRASNMSMVA